MLDNADTVLICSLVDLIGQVAAVAQSLSAMTKDRDAAVGQVQLIQLLQVSCHVFQVTRRTGRAAAGKAGSSQ